jgi:hypothetical protein
LIYTPLFLVKKRDMRVCAIELNKAEMKEENERKDGVRGNEGDVCISRRRQVKKANEHFPPPHRS